MAKPRPTYYGNEDQYPKYDNYDAIEVSRTMHIPCDYDGVIGVPITFLEHFSPDQFDILGITLTPGCYDNTNVAKRTTVYKKAVQVSPDNSTQSGGKINDGPAILLKGPLKKGVYYTEPSSGKMLKKLYARILIKRKAKSYDN